MDAVELGYPVDVPNVMGSEVFGKARVSVNEVEAAACDSSSRVSILVNTSIDRCSTLLRQKGVKSTVSKDKIPESEPCKHESQGLSLRFEDSLEQLLFRGTSCPSSVQVQLKARKMPSSSSRCSKRPRLAQLEDNTSLAGVDDIKDISDNLGSYHTTKCNSLEKMQMVKQKNNYSGKRGDKRNFKVPMKAKYDSFSMKAGLASSGSAAGGNNFFGVYGLKPDILDITKHVDDLSLKDLLDNSFECPSLGKDKGKKTANLNEHFLHSVRKSFSSLQLAKPAQPQNFAEMGSSTNSKLLICPPNSISMGDDGDKGNSCTTDQSSCDKESCSKPGTPVNHLDFHFQLYKPKDILEKLALPPPKDLEALLLDAAKPSASSRSNSDIRSGKQISRRASLPPFPWSHSFSGHFRSNSDAVKLLTSRSTCQGRWERIATSTTSLRTPTDCFTNLESLTYSQSLVPVSSSISRPWGDWGSSTLETCSKASVVNLESGVNLKDQVNAEHCPRVLAAAQTLSDIATHSYRRNPDGITRWPKKPSQKAMKARKSKLSGEVFTTGNSQLASDNPVGNGTEKIASSKRPKLSVIEKIKDLNHINGTRKGPINWSTPRSSRSSPNKTVGDTIAEKIHSTTNILRQSCMMPPPAKVLDKACPVNRSYEK